MQIFCYCRWEMFVDAKVCCWFIGLPVLRACLVRWLWCSPLALFFHFFGGEWKKRIFRMGKIFKINIKHIYLCQESSVIFLKNPYWAVCKKHVQRLGIEVPVLRWGKTSSSADFFTSDGSWQGKSLEKHGCALLINEPGGMVAVQW